MSVLWYEDEAVSGMNDLVGRKMNGVYGGGIRFGLRQGKTKGERYIF